MLRGFEMIFAKLFTGSDKKYDERVSGALRGIINGEPYFLSCKSSSGEPYLKIEYLYNSCQFKLTYIAIHYGTGRSVLYRYAKNTGHSSCKEEANTIGGYVLSNTTESKILSVKDARKIIIRDIKSEEGRAIKLRKMRDRGRIEIEKIIRW
jgi:hypothetical protein